MARLRFQGLVCERGQSGKQGSRDGGHKNQKRQGLKQKKLDLKLITFELLWKAG